MVVKKSRRSLPERTLITIVRFGLSVKATLSTRDNSTRKKRKKPVKLVAPKAADRKQKNYLDNPLDEMEEVPFKVSSGVSITPEDEKVLDITIKELEAEARADRRKKGKDNVKKITNSVRTKLRSRNGSKPSTDKVRAGRKNVRK